MNSPDPLDDLLRQWQEPAAPSTSFRREVWGRIAVDGRDRKVSFMERFASLFSRPPVMTTFLVLALSLGGILSWTAEVRRPVEDQARNQYVRSINPFDSSHQPGHGK